MVRGSTSTTDLGRRQIIDMSSEITMLNAGENPFTMILKKISKASCFNLKFEWMQDFIKGINTTVNMIAGFATGVTSLVVTDPSIFKPQDIIRIMYGDNLFSDVMLVEDVTDATSTLTVRRQISTLNGETGTAMPAAIPNGAIVFIIGNAFEEGSLSAAINSTQFSNFYNYVQNFKTAFGVTGRANATKLYSPKDLDWQRKKKGVEHMREIELALMFGERSLFTDVANQNTTTGGIWQYVNTEVHGGVTTPNVLTEAEWDAFVETLFEYNYEEGKPTKTVFCGSLVMRSLTAFAKPYIRISQKDKTFGLEITQYNTPFGTVNLIYHPRVFNLPMYSNLALGVDFKSLKYRFLEGRDTKLKTNLQENDRDGQKDEYETDCGLQVTAPEVNAKLIIDRT